MAFTSKDRQRIIDEYLSATGRNMFVPGEFVDWLSGQPDHEAYDWFFGQGDEEAARNYRITMARKMASGLRITAKVTATPDKGNPVSVKVREFPAMISPIHGRKHGGGYELFDPKDDKSQEELRQQAAASLRSWLSRYRGVAEHAGVNVGPIEEIATALSGRVVGAA